MVRSAKEDIDLLKFNFIKKNHSKSKLVSSLELKNKKLNNLNKKYKRKIISLQKDIKDIEDLLR
jgi:hypothetical protein